ncbi:hypothetical protein AUEXF2481DRAFT_61033 [Aureobasidium subglaciale EXF-2481]|uniref:GmrSD restriction endonucleases C-terminal domain-containing protein n=1 Tax=Aureobasidium subglaciale (strain EXF-2481) TaxID=1043005 RepID=A0A074YSQ5_AURSE|nr:uncharacterized protein AUEXF2481DRAFT_61033 [Aureobasidium subglaciale EXF-2481]KAI5210366.1 hypothetical protein E4T38_02072 [Aureobasidium subglaciale]KAI5229044.1 hypothetical protein E4T40_01822 [Aureobasidium subglaciale]KAI5232790.1 hypothetical protein E4T41_02042 [Aureobasidium subglaciale]KAI5266006.1 hypothetical protein E4T46_01849 [Aureobasidium subglaciale]KER00716.1 hypothetical protein AUEXF2481DRAFT_61033 [Aureobasidium subglaciale EXF-2481]
MVSQSTLLLAGTASLALAAPIERRGNLPTPISAATAIQYLSSIPVAAESNSPAYDRDLFKHWITISGACNTRETVLKRDGSNVVTSSACAATSGSWYSDYDGKTWSAAADVDIDHLVPLKEAWVSGAKDWTNERRQQFANDLTRPQLLAVTDSLNQAKGDQDLAEWLPPLVSYQCEYVRAWVQVKSYYGLSMDSAEKAAASKVLTGC